MTPLVIRNDKPYFVAENKDNSNYICYFRKSY